MLKFYIISTVLVFIIVVISALSMASELKREGIIPTSKSTLVELIRAYLLCLVPFVNIILGLIFIFNYDTIKEKLRDKWTNQQA
jgi:cadmium resistance protein CadD (predicted permease)